MTDFFICDFKHNEKIWEVFNFQSLTPKHIEH